jgi:Bacterial pre-peptidase C-terminal domain
MPRWFVLWVIGVLPALGQTCAPARILPVGSVAGTLDDSNCQLPDATAYAAYRLDLPVRGQIALDLATSNDFILILRDATGAKVDLGLSIHRPIEAGSYTLLVDARIPGQVGGYAVKSAFTAEPGMLCTAFPSLGISQTVAGALGSSGCTLPAGTAYEGYWVNTYGGGILTVTVTSTDFTPTVIVRGSDGSPVASGQGTAAAEVDAGSQYEVLVTTADTTGAYQLATGFQVDPAETCLATKALAAQDSDAGSVTGNSCYSTLAGSGDLYFYNYYTIAVGAAGVADVAVSSHDFAPVLYLLDDGGNVLATDSGGGAASDPSMTASEIRMQVRPGNYTVQLVSSLASGGAYQLNYGFTAGAPQPCGTVTLNPGDGPAGTLSAASCRTATGLADLYTVTTASAGTLQFTVTSGSAVPAVALRDLKDNLIVLNEDVQGQGITHISADLPAGAYMVAAAAVSGAGAYQLASQFSAHDIPACSAAQTMDINGGYVQSLGVPGCKGANGQPVDYYQFTLPADGVVAAFMTSSDVDGYLTLLDSNGNALRADDNSYGYADPMIVQYLPAGTYQLAARAAGYSVGGYYEVDVRTTMGERPPFCGLKGTLAVGGGASGTIGYTSCQYTDATFADIYQVQLTSTTSVDLRVSSSDFDAYLVLLDAQGNLVDQDDDSGGGTNARITTLLGAGTYYVVAKPNGDYTKGGNYTVSLAAQ